MMNEKVWLIHYEYHNSYKSKNLGLFARYMSNHYDVEFLTTKIISYEPFMEKNIKVNEILNNDKNLFNMDLIMYIIKNIKDVKYIWCYNTNYKFIALLLVLSRIYNTKIIIKLDSIWNMPQDNILSKARYYLSNILFLNSYKLLYESDTIKEKIPTFLHKKCFKYLVTYSETFAEQTSLNNLIVKENIILISARIYENKNIHTIVDIFIENILLFSEWKLIIVGDDFDREYANKLKKQAQDYKNILFEGFKSGNEYYKYFEKAKIFILPSYLEGQPNVIVEAIYFGCKVLVTENANVSDFIDDKNVEFINPNEKKDILDKLTISMLNYDSNIIEHNHNKAIKEYLFEEQIKSLLDD